MKLLLKLQFLRAYRSVSLSRNLVGMFFLGLVVFLLLIYVMMAAFMMDRILRDVFGAEDTIQFLNEHLFFVVMFEFFYRFFLQKLPVIELANFLHLPISRKSIVKFMMLKSLVSSFTIIMPLLFAPFAFLVIGAELGSAAAWSWFLTIVALSWSLHWFVLWFKQYFGDNLVGIVAIFAIYLLGFGAYYFELYNIGTLMSPLFSHATHSFLPAILMVGILVGLYVVVSHYYTKMAYLEDLTPESQPKYLNQKLGFLSRFGIIGEIADLEWKLIIRHKKPRNYLIISIVFLLYGLLFYTDSNYSGESGFSHFFVFIGIFVTGVFMFQYGQLFLSWNSANFDFFLIQNNGADSLIRGKYLLFIVISVMCFIITVPYVYFGWNILFAHFATFLFNMGVNLHLVTLMALWKPKPMDLNKSAIFNYEGVGAAQFLMFFPLTIIPYLVYLPVALIVDFTAGLIALSSVGILGIVFHKQLTQIAVDILIKNRYEISTTFRQET